MSESKRAFCPGHLTAFFEICDSSEDPLKKGSRGVGICLSLGATSNVQVADSNAQKVAITINSKTRSADVTRDTIKFLVGNKKLKIDIDTIIDLPVEQGFAMSAAGALSASFALCSILGIPSSKAFEATHLAEIENSTGLGDVAGLSARGVELRSEPGLPPHGQVEQLHLTAELVICTVGRPIKTREILADTSIRMRCCAAGRRCIAAFSEHPTIEHLFVLGMEFIEETELSSPEVLRAMCVAEQYGMASMVMLGNSIFCVGDTAELLDALKPFGQTFVCEVDQKGPRLL